MIDDRSSNLAAAKDRIASIARADEGESIARLGRLTLRSHQLDAVRRLLVIIGRYRGALLADAVGLGKTYVALAIAREHARPLVICPAALREMWTRAMTTASLTFPVVSIESLSRGERPLSDPDIVIIDEAHHLRTPGTQRYEAVARLAHRCRLLLLSATPLQNSRRDLTSVLALFLGSAVHAWTDQELARVIVRRDEATAGQTLPTLVGPQALSPGADDDCLEAICALPTAVPAADEGTAAALAAMSLVHLWASSRAALVASLRARRARAVALKDAIASGHLPTAADLAAWHYADEAVQLAFPFCVSAAGVAIDGVEIGRRLDEYIGAVTNLLAACEKSSDPDVARAELLRSLRDAHRGSRIVAFSQYAQTVSALGRLLRTDPGVATVTADSARIASGPIARQEILDQFAGDAAETSIAERVGLLLSTDLLSEGVDLRGASVIVNLDLPWNPARLEQRVGRARRIGSPHAAIHVYTFVPPTAAERMLTLKQRLSTKVQMADGIVGGVRHPAFAVDAFEPAPPSPVTAVESLRAKLGTWLDPMRRRELGGTIVAAGTAPVVAWLALVSIGGLPHLIHGVGDDVIEDPGGFAAAMDLVGDARASEDTEATSVLCRIERWLSAKRFVNDLGVEPGYPSAKRAVLDRLAQSVTRAPRHRRAAVLAAAQRARAGVSAVAGIGAERILEELVRSPAEDEAWIRSVESFGALHSHMDSISGDSPGESTPIAAVILLGPPARSSEPAKLALEAAAAPPSTHS